MLSSSPVDSLLKVFDVVMILQDFFLDVLRHALQPVILCFFIAGTMFLSLDTCTCPIRSLRFLFLLYGTTGGLVKVGARSLEV